MKTLVFSIAILFFGSLGAWAEKSPDADDDDSISNEAIVERYMSAREEQQNTLRGVQMEVDIDARIPKLKKYGRLHALRNISKVGKITYRMLGFNGDNTVKKDVIARYLTAEVQAQGGQDLSISPLNYKFKYKGVQVQDGRDTYVFRLSPRKKRVGLFKGELWLDAKTYMPVRESGRFVKSPSIFFKKMEFVRTYELEGGVSVPQRIDSRVDTRIVGPVELSINFSNLAKVTDEETSASSSTSATE